MVQASSSLGNSVNAVDLSDEDLMQAIQESNSDAFTALYQRYDQELHAYLRIRMGNSAAADDVFQETFFQLHSKPASFRADASLRTWLYTIATNKSIDYYRRERRHRMPSLHQLLSQGNSSDSDDETLDVPGKEPDPFQVVSKHDDADQVEANLDQLDRIFIDVVEQVYYLGLTYQDTADKLGIPIGTVKSRLHRAIELLQGMYSATADRVDTVPLKKSA